MSQQPEALQTPKFKASDLDNIHPTGDLFVERKQEAWQTYWGTIYSDKSSANIRSKYCWSWRYFIEFSEEAVRRLHEQEVKIQNLEAKLKRSRAASSSISSTQNLSLSTATTSTISITPSRASVGTSTQTTIQVSATPSHQTISIVTPTSSSISINHGSSEAIIPAQKSLEERFKNLEDSINKLTITTPPATETPASPTTGPDASTVASTAVGTDTGLTTETALSTTNTGPSTPIATPTATPPLSPKATRPAPEGKAPERVPSNVCLKCFRTFYTREEYYGHITSPH